MGDAPHSIIRSTQRKGTVDTAPLAQKLANQLFRYRHVFEPAEHAGRAIDRIDVQDDALMQQLKEEIRKIHYGQRTTSDELTEVVAIAAQCRVSHPADLEIFKAARLVESIRDQMQLLPKAAAL